MHAKGNHNRPERTIGLACAVLLSFLDQTTVARAGSSHQAVLIAGGATTQDAVWTATDYLAGRAFTTLLSRGFAKADFRYLSMGPARDVDGDGNAANDITHPTASLSDVADTFTTWVRNVDSLTVIVLGHGLLVGSTAGFQLNATETVTAIQLDTWLDALQQIHPNLHATVVLDYSFAEQSMAALSYSGPSDRRIVVASTRGADRAHFISGGLISFSQHFFDGVRAGDNLHRCFTETRDAMGGFQGAGLDDTQDGVPSKSDGEWAQTRFIGSDTGGSVVRPDIGAVVPDQQLSGATSASFWVEGITPSGTLDRVWCTVVPPGYAPGSSTGAPVTEIATREFEEGVNGGRVRYQATFDGFTIDGEYSLQVYAMEPSGAVSLPAFTTATQQGRVEMVLLVAGGDPMDSKWPEVRNLSKRVFLSLRDRLIPPDQIQYLSPIAFEDFDGDGANDVDQQPELLAIQNAILKWAADADRLMVYLIGQVQADARFRVNSSEFLHASDLGDWLESFQSTNRPAIVVMDFPSSGDYLAALTPYTLAPRTLIGSSRANRMPVLADDLSFSDFFANRLQAGESVGRAAMWARTASRKASGSLFQNVLIDDNGNGIPNEKGVDGQASTNIQIGTPFFPGTAIPRIELVMPETFLSPTTTSVELFVDGVSDADGIDSVRAHVTPPTNVADAVSSQTFLSRVGNSAKWAALVPGFDRSGPYHVTFIAEDGLGNVRHSRPTLLLKSDFDRLAVTDPMDADAREPDDSVGTSRLSDLPVLRYQTLHSSTDADWIKFYARPESQYDIGFLNVGGVLDLSIQLYREVSNSFPDMEATVLALVDTVDEFSADGDEVVSFDFVTGGFYYLKTSAATNVDFTTGGYVTHSTALNILEGINVMVVEQGGPGPLINASVTIRRPLSLQLLASQVVGPEGLVNFPGFAAGAYLIEVDPQAPGYAGYFDPMSPTDQPQNRFSDYGNPRWIGPGDFQVTQFEDGPSFEAAWAGFYFLPVAYITGVVRDTVYGASRRVDNAFISLTQLPDVGVVFQAWPWATYGQVWWSSAQGQFPATTQVLANHAYALYVQKPHYEPWGVQTPNLGVGQTFNAGNALLVPEDVNDNGIPDPWEFEIFQMLIDGEGDSDFDHTTHYGEYVAGTNPLIANSVFRLPEIARTEAGVQLTWTVENLRNYRVYTASDPSKGEWTLEAGPFASFGFVTEMAWTDPLAEASPHKAYLVEVRIWPH